MSDLGSPAAASADAPVPPLARHLPAEATAEALLEGFLAYLEDKSLTPYPAQEEALLELFEGNNVILATPTGSGKSLVAAGLCAKAIVEGGRAFYTAPIKALVSEKFFDLCRELGAERVGLMTGDASVNRDAPIICCTAEILASLALREGDDAGVTAVVMDEFHYYGDKERGVAWQLPLLVLERAQFLLMSATLGDVSFFEQDLQERTGRKTTTIRAAERPVPLDFEYRETPLHETLAELIESERAPVYVVHFSQRAAAEFAQNLMSVEIVSKERKNQIRERLHGFRWDTPFGKDLSRWVKHGVGVHHAGLLPKYRLLVEKLAQEGLLGVISGTDTLGVGVNVPIRSVLFTQLCKYDGDKTAVLSVRDFHQIAGRAGRKGFDTRGYVLAQAPIHAIENLSARKKAEGDAKKMRKLVVKKPPDRGYAHFDEQTFQRLIEGEPERLESRFRVSHGMLLGILQGAEERGVDGCKATRQLIRRAHGTRTRLFAHGRHALALYRSLRDAGVLARGGAGKGGGALEIDVDLQDNFSLNNSLSLFVIDAITKLDPQSPDYAADTLSIVESVLEDPGAVLFRMLDVLKGKEIARMKAEGLDYDERMKELDEVELPKPCAELIESAFEDFGERHPWVGRQAVRPKSVARDMWERGASFTEYVREYGMARVEGVLLRYLSDASKTLTQTVPETAKTDELLDLEDWLRATVRLVDSSLLDEWEALNDPAAAAARAASTELAEPPARDVTDDPKALAVLMRNVMFRIVRSLSRRDLDDVARFVVAPEGADAWTPESLQAALAPFEASHGAIRIDAAARSPKLTRIEREGDLLRVEQVLLDDADDADFWIEARVDLALLREEGEPRVELVAIRGE